MFDGQNSTGLIKGVQFGILGPGVNVVKTLYLVNTGAAGDRVLDISIQSRAISKSSPEASPTTPISPDTQAYRSDTSETLQTLTVPTIDPIKVSYGVGYRRPLTERPGLANLTTFEDEFWDDGEGGEALVNATMEVVGPWSLEILSAKLIHKVRIFMSVPLRKLTDDRTEIMQ